MGILLKLITSRFAGPIGLIVSLLLIAVAMGQCSAKVGEGRRADRAEEALSIANFNLSTCRENTKVLRTGLADQTAEVNRLASESAGRLAAAEKGLGEAMKGRAKAEADAAKLLRNPPAGIDACARAVSAFENVKELTP